MNCSECAHCRGFQLSNGKYTVMCATNGKFDISEQYGDMFQCEQFKEMPEEPVEVPKTPNVSIVLKSGLTVDLYDKDIYSRDDIYHRIGDYDDGCSEIVIFGDDYAFLRSEIAMYRYISENG